MWWVVGGHCMRGASHRMRDPGQWYMKLPLTRVGKITYRRTCSYFFVQYHTGIYRYGIDSVKRCDITHSTMPDIPGPVTYDHVAQAVAELKAANKRPSWRAVRAQLGKGSPNTILEHLRALDRHQAEQTADTAVPPPAAITELVGTKVWQAALAAARDQVAHDRTDLELRLAAEAARADELAAAVERLEEQLAEARRQTAAQVGLLERLATATEQAATQATDRQAQTDAQHHRLFSSLTAIAAAQADHRSATTELRTTTAINQADLLASVTAIAQTTSQAIANLATPLASLDVAVQDLTADHHQLTTDWTAASERLSADHTLAAQHTLLGQRHLMARLDRLTAMFKEHGRRQPA
jgi:hypothetical protein